MNENNIPNRVYAQKVELLLRLMPIVMEEGVQGHAHRVQLQYLQAAL